MTMNCREWRNDGVPLHTLKYAPATLVESVAATFPHQLLEYAPHDLDSIHQVIQLCELSVGERSPAFRRTNDIAEAKEQLPDFTQRKTELTRSLDDRQAIKHGLVVASLPTLPVRRGEQANPLVIANRRGSKPNLMGNLRNSELRHAPF
jgi:hypothetical protein